MRRLASLFFLCLAACGSAAEFSATPPATATGAPSGSQPLALASYEVVVDPLNTQMIYTPVTTLAAIADQLFLQQSDYLAEATTPATVQMVSGWSTLTYDIQQNGIHLDDDGGPCLLNDDSKGQSFNHLRAYLSHFSEASITPADGAASIAGGKYEVDFGKLNAGEMSCRTFALFNTSAVNYRFWLTFVTDELTDEIFPGHIEKMTPAVWPNQTTVKNLDFTGSGFTTGLDSLLIVSQATYESYITQGITRDELFQSGQKMPFDSVGISTDTELLGNLTPSGDLGLDSFYVLIESDVDSYFAGEPIFVYKGDMQVTASLRYTGSAPSQPASSRLWWYFCSVGCDVSSGLPSGGFQLSIVNAVALNSDDYVPMQMKNLSSTLYAAAIAANSFVGVYVAYDNNQSGDIDSGDTYGYYEFILGELPLDMGDIEMQLVP